MRLITDDILKVFKQQARKAKKADIAVAYFSPSEEQLEYLKKIPRLRILISDSFHINNPYKLALLKDQATLKSIDSQYGMLHAKIYLFRLRNNKTTCIIGSANFSCAGFEHNREASLFLDSDIPHDKMLIEDIKEWYEINFKDGDKIKLKKQMERWDKRPKRKWFSKGKKTMEDEISYWVIKTTAGAYGEDMWEYFIDDEVIAIGWNYIDIDPDNIPSKIKLRKMLYEEYFDPDKPDKYTEEHAIKDATTILNFTSIKPNDRVIISHGYTPNQWKKDVYLYGIAEVTSPFYDEPESEWWRQKHDAEIYPIKKIIPIEDMREIFGGSLWGALHSITKEEYDALEEYLKNEMGEVIKL